MNPTDTLPSAPRAAARARRLTRSSASSVSRTPTTRSSPAGVSATWRGVRRSSVTPSARSSEATWRLTCGWESPSASAARPKCSSSATATKARSCGSVGSMRSAYGKRGARATRRTQSADRAGGASSAGRAGWALLSARPRVGRAAAGAGRLAGPVPVLLEVAASRLLALAVLIAGDAEAEHPVEQQHRQTGALEQSKTVDTEPAGVEDEHDEPGDNADQADAVADEEGERARRAAGPYAEHTDDATASAIAVLIGTGLFLQLLPQIPCLVGPPEIDLRLFVGVGLCGGLA